MIDADFCPNTIDWLIDWLEVNQYFYKNCEKNKIKSSVF